MIDKNLQKIYENMILEYNIKPEPPDYKQNLIDDVVEEIQKAKAKSNDPVVQSVPTYRLEYVIDYCKQMLRDHPEHGFTEKQIDHIIQYALYDRPIDLKWY